VKRNDFTFSFIEKKIRSKTFGILTTINKDGTPHSTGMLFGVSPPSSKFALNFFTSLKYKKVRNIKRNPNVSLIIPFPHYYIRFAPSGTVTFNGKAKLSSINDNNVKNTFAKKRVLRLVLKEIENQGGESFTFIQLIPNPKVLCFGIGFNVFKLRRGHKQGGYSVRIPNKRLS
jgi:general stress protein 26